MVKKKSKKEADSAYLLKIVLYFLLGMMWLRININDHAYPIPLGFVFGLVFAHHEHFQLDRKIEYAILVAAMFASYYLPVGILLGA